MKQLISILLIIIIIFLTGTSTVFAKYEPSEKGGLYGDLDHDNYIDTSDALHALQASVGKISVSSLWEYADIAADVDGDNKISSNDALKILQYSIKKITTFPVGDVYDRNPLSSTEYTDCDSSYISYDASDFDFNTSLSVNGAYANDSTADYSFVMDMTGLDRKTIYLLSDSVLHQVDEARLVYCLQGLVNRDFGRDLNHSSIIYVNADKNFNSDMNWLNFITEEDSVYYGYTVKNITTFDDFYITFENQIKYCGMILWDGNVASTANVSTTICGLDGYLPVLANSPLHTTLLSKGVEVKFNLFDMFKNGNEGNSIPGTDIVSTGSAKNDAYLWALDKYFNRCSSNYLAYILDGACTVKGYDYYEDNKTALLPEASLNCLSNHDYIIARRAFCFDLDPYKRSICCDDIAQQNRLARPGTDNETLLKIFSMRYSRANGAMGQLLGFPPWWLKYTTFRNQGTCEATWLEWLFTEYLSCYNLAKEADAAQPCSMTNGSVYYKYVPLSENYKNNWEEYDSGVKYSDDTLYYTIYMGDYDSSAWLKNYVNAFWINNDSARGTIPLTWCFNPNLSNRVPMIFEYIYSNKYDNEFIAAGDCGAGYIIPSALYKKNSLNYSGSSRPSNYQDGDTAWYNYCKKFYERFDIKATGFIINGTNNLTTDIMSLYNRFSPMGSLHNSYADMMGTYDNVPYIYCNNGIDESTSPADIYDHAFNSMNGFNFAAYRTVCSSPTAILNIITKFNSYAEAQGKKVQYVELYTFLDLASKSGQGFKVNSIPTK